MWGQRAVQNYGMGHAHMLTRVNKAVPDMHICSGVLYGFGGPAGGKR